MKLTIYFFGRKDRILWSWGHFSCCGGLPVTNETKFLELFNSYILPIHLIIDFWVIEVFGVTIQRGIFIWPLTKMDTMMELYI